jgi:nitrous oxide reductase accessory protein NosL
MKLAILTALAAGTALAGCGEIARGETAEDKRALVAKDTSVDLSDGLIVCEMTNYDGNQGLTVNQTFAIVEGQPKRYSAFENVAFDLCQPEQERCTLAIEDGAIRMDYTSPNGTRSRYEVDLGTMLITARESGSASEERIISFEEGAICRRESLPEGLTIN